MKKIFYTLSFIISISANALVDTITVKTKIIDATIFFEGAQVRRTSLVKLSKGKHILKIDKLPQDINPQSVKVEEMGGCTILSVKHEISYPKEGKKDVAQTTIEDKIKAQELKIKEIMNKSSIYDLEEKILLDNSVIKRKEQGSVVIELKETADFYRIRLNEIRTAKLNLSTDLDNANKKLQETYIQLNEIVSQKRRIYSQVIVTIECEKDFVSSDLKLSYYTLSAGWEPLYDFRVEDISKPLSIVYNANVYQSSGEDWNNINIKLSNSNPSLSGEKPELEPWYLGRNYSNNKPQKKLTNGVGAIKFTVVDEKTGEPIPFANIVIYQSNETAGASVTNIEGEAIIKPLQSGYYAAKVSYVGYSQSQVNNISVKSNKTSYAKISMNQDAVELNEVQIVEYSEPLIDAEVKAGSTITREEYSNMPSRNINSVSATTFGVYQFDTGDKLNVRGSRNSNNGYFVDGVKVETNNISNSLRATATNIEYSIDVPYSIPCDGEDYTLKIKEVNLPVSYYYRAVPKLDEDAFLLAEITDWSSLNLLSGKASIFYQGTFTGESNIDTDNLTDTLNLSLGRDKNILVKRESSKEMIDKRIIGNTIKETVGWKINVKNNKTSKIRIIIEDQYPLSERKSVEVELLESVGAKLDQATGKLTWDLSIEPNDKKTITYKYSVKYPKGNYLSVE